MFVTIANYLQTSAEICVSFLSEQYGIRVIKREEALEQGIQYLPTIWGKNHDYYYICIDVAENLLSNARMEFAEDCIRKGFPAKLFVAIEKNNEYTGFKSDLVKIHEKGIGLIEVDSLTRLWQILILEQKVQYS
jgi:hypothetical protein